MPSFWNTPPSSSTSATQDFSDPSSPTSSTVSPYRNHTFDKFSDNGETRRSQSQAGIMEALMSPRQVLSPSSSKIIHPSQSSNFIGGTPSGYASRYLPRQISLDNSQNFIHENRIPFSRTLSNETDNDLFNNNIPHELNFVTLRRPSKRLGKNQPTKDRNGSEDENQDLRQLAEGQANHFPLRRQTSGSYSTSTLDNLNENEIPLRSGLDHSMLKEKSINGRQNRSLHKNGSNYNSFCSTLGENDENSFSEAK